LPLIWKGLAILTITYVALYYGLQESILYLLPPPHSDFCESHACARSDLFAFQVASGIALSAAAMIGWREWKPLLDSTSSAEVRLFGYIPASERLAAISFAFQIFDFVVSLGIPEHRTVIMLLHHLAAATVSFCSFRFTMLQAYGIFFLGLSEVSSVFLVFVDLARYFPPVPGSFYDNFIRCFAAPGFVLCFIIYRVFYWWPVSMQLFRDVFHVTVTTQRAQQLRPGNVWVLYLYLVLNVPLGLLQLYWLTVIFDEAKKAFLNVA
jgi:hypothetical protein